MSGEPSKVPPPRPPPPYSAADGAEQPPSYGAAAPPPSSLPPPPASSALAVPAPASSAPTVVASPPITTTVFYQVPTEPVLPQEGPAIVKAFDETLPALHMRLCASLQRSVALNINLNDVLAVCTNPRARVHALEALLASLNVLVSGIEEAARDPGVQIDMAAKIAFITITNQIVGPAAVPSIVTFGAGLLYTGVFEKGQMAGGLTRKDIHAFFEELFFAEERYLIRSFMGQSLPGFTKRLEVACGKIVPVYIDIPALLSKVTLKEKRLQTTKVIISDVGLTRDIRKTTEGVARLFGSATQTYDETHSTHVFEPFVSAVEFCMSTIPDNTELRAAIANIVFEHVGGVHSKAKQLTFRTTAGEVLPPQAFFTPGSLPQDLTLVYTGCFESGTSGCLTKDEVVTFFEVFFRCQERALVKTYLESTIPSALTVLGKYVGKSFRIDTQWDTILPSTLPLENRLDVIKTLCANSSANVIHVIVKSFEAIAAKTPNGIMAIQNVASIVIRGLPGKSLPTLNRLVLADGTSLLEYCVGLEYGLSGCCDEMRFKKAFRDAYQLPTPPEDKGVMGVVKTISGDVSRMGDALSRGIGSFFK